jgi:hypothetical protein
MKKMKLGLLAVALLGTAAAFAGKAGDTFSYQNGSGGTISQAQYLSCPNTSLTLCGQKIDNQTQQVVEVRYYNH